MDRLFPIEAEGSGCDLAGHVKERPSCVRKLFLEFVRLEVVLERHPGARIWLVFEAYELREQRTLFDENGAGGDQLFGLSTLAAVHW